MAGVDWKSWHIWEGCDKYQWLLFSLRLWEEAPRGAALTVWTIKCYTLLRVKVMKCAGLAGIHLQ